MPLEKLLGRTVALPVRELTSRGARLESEEELWLPRREVPEGTRAGDELTVFVYLDSEDAPQATTRAPALERGEVAFLEVRAMTPVGAFLAWGLEKDLLLPRKEQTRAVQLGERHPVALYLDDTDRLAATMRVSELLRAVPPYEVGTWVPGEAWRKAPGMGVFVVLDRRYVGLLPESEPHHLTRGAAENFRVARVLPDGKVMLSLRGTALEERDADGEKILSVLARSGAPRVGDHSSPELLRSLFGLSKKAFKRAVGGLLKRGAVRFDSEGFLVLEPR